MFPNSHKLIAEKVYLALATEMGVNLHYPSLAFGSVAPDYKPSMLIKSHRKKYSYNIVVEMVESLKEFNYINKAHYVKELSYRLGVVIHFVTDYFCRAHNENKYYNFILHYMYERKLNCFIETRFKASPEVVRWDLVKKWNGYSGFDSLLEDALHDYHCKKPSLTVDMEYAVAVSIMAAMSLVNAYADKTVLFGICDLEHAIQTA